MGSMDQVAGGMGTRAMQSYIEAKVSRVPRVVSPLAQMGARVFCWPV